MAEIKEIQIGQNGAVLNIKDETARESSGTVQSVSAGGTTYEPDANGDIDISGAIPDTGGKYEKPSTGIPKSDLASDVQTSLGKADTAVQPVAGKGLSTEDYTTAEKTKLAGLSNYDDTALTGRVTALESNKADSADLADVATSGSYDDLTNKPTIPVIPSNVSAFTNDAGYLTSHQDISGKSDVVTKVQVSGNTPSQALLSGVFYEFTGALTSLTLTLTAPANGMGIYAGKFTSDSTTATVLSVPASVNEATNNDTIGTGKTYEFSIVDNIIVVKEVS